MAESSSSENYATLREMLDEGLKLFYKVENATEATSSDNVQADIKKAIEILEEATRRVSQLNIFSRNEEISDMATADIQYLSLPFLLGRFTGQLVSRDRSELVEIMEIYFKDFLKRTNDYGLSNHPLNVEAEDDKNKKKNNQPKTMQDACRFRDMKLKQHSEKRKFEKLVTDLKGKLDSADDDTKREYYINLIKYFVCLAIEDLKFAEDEKVMLEMRKKQMSKQRTSGQQQKQAEKPQTRKPLQAVIITKDEVQKAIYGAGYPSLPTMTVAEFYDKRVRDGVFPDPTKPKTGPMSLQEASLAGLSLDDEKEKEVEVEESKIENDDEELLRRQRDQDEYKDNHRRGWGNRANRS